MSLVVGDQPDSTPTWIDLEVPDLERAQEFYGALFDWTFATTSAATSATGGSTTCLLRGLAVAAFRPVSAPGPAPGFWRMYFAARDCDATARRVVDAGGTLTQGPLDVGDRGRTALASDSVGARFGLWQGGTHPGCRIVNEPGSLVRNDLSTPEPGPARDFYTALFGLTLDGNQDLPGFDFTFLRRPDGHEIGGIFGDPTDRRRLRLADHLRGGGHRRGGGAHRRGRRHGRRPLGLSVRPDGGDHRSLRHRLPRDRQAPGPAGVSRSGTEGGGAGLR